MAHTMKALQARTPHPYLAICWFIAMCWFIVMGREKMLVTWCISMLALSEQYVSGWWLK